VARWGRVRLRARLGGMPAAGEKAGWRGALGAGTGAPGDGRPTAGEEGAPFLQAARRAGREGGPELGGRWLGGVRRLGGGGGGGCRGCRKPPRRLWLLLEKKT
jgi:hypothetical protein